MIRQPDFVTEAIAQEAIQRSSKLPEDLKEQVVFKKMEEGLCAQILHVRHMTKNQQRLRN